jgi:hypothetical protein
MELAPTEYRCPDHGDDLTDEVRRELSEQIPAAFGSGKPRPFKVIVECPGGGAAHELLFTGTMASGGGSRFAWRK